MGMDGSYPHRCTGWRIDGIWVAVTMHANDRRKYREIVDLCHPEPPTVTITAVFHSTTHGGGPPRRHVEPDCFRRIPPVTTT